MARQPRRGKGTAGKGTAEPPERMRDLTVRLPETTIADAQKQAQAEGRTVSNLLRVIITTGLEQRRSA